MAASAILLVDDDQDTCASLSEVISDLGYRVDMAYDGPAALELSRRHPDGLDNLDSKLPGPDFVLLPERRSVRVGPRAIALTPTQFRLLAVLLAAPGRTFTRA
jgi:DNA-binding response OmpR family regulator